MSTYTPSAPLSTGYESGGVTAIIAPFFADVDTSQGGGTVTYGSTTVDGRPAWAAYWTDVDYYNASSPGHVPKSDTFSVTLVDRSDIQPGDFDIIFNYGQITWETGDASGGSDGLGGNAARAGYSNGSGEEGTYYELSGSGEDGGLLGLSGTYTYEIRDPSVGLTAYRTGGNYGTAVSAADQQSGDPSNYVVVADHNYTQGQPINLSYNEIARITLDQVTSRLPGDDGTVNLVLSDPSAVQLYDDEGQPLTDLSEDIDDGGYLAGLASGNVTVYVLALTADPDFKLTYQYEDESGNVEAQTSIDMAIADFSAVGVTGNTLSALSAIGDPAGLFDGSDSSAMYDLYHSLQGSEYKLLLSGLSSQQIDQLAVSSSTGGQYDDTLTDTAEGAESNNFATLVNDDADGSQESLLTSLVPGLNTLNFGTVSVSLVTAKDQHTFTENAATLNLTDIDSLTIDVQQILSQATLPPGFDIGAAQITSITNVLGGTVSDQDGTWVYTPNSATDPSNPFDSDHPFGQNNNNSGGASFLAQLSDGQKTVQVNTAVTGMQVISAATINQSGVTGQLSHNLNVLPGAYLPLNNEDFDNDGTIDMNQVGPVAGDRFLLPFTLSPTNAATGGFYFLTIPTNVRVWENADRSGVVVSGTAISATQTTLLYVEGIGVGTAQIFVSWGLQASAPPTDVNVDQLNVNVFEFIGAQNVPDFGSYTYSYEGANASDSSFKNPLGGTQQSFDLEARTMTVLWGQGPQTGEVVCQLDNNYTWDYTVNVVEVQVTLTNPDPPPSGAFSVTPEEGFIYLESELGFQAQVTVTDTGSNHLQIGFIQNAAELQQTWWYDNVSLVSPITGAGWYLDSYSTDGSPWYNDDVPGSQLNISGPGTYVFNLGDALFRKIPALNPVPNGGQLETVTDLVEFNTYLAVRTTDSGNGADKTYVEKAVANWNVDWGGAMQGGVFVGLDATPVSVVSLTTVNDGDNVPVVTPPVINDAFNDQPQWIVTDH